MSDPILFWTKWAAIGQLAGAAATLLAVVVSLYIALHGRRPGVRLTVGIRVIIGGNLPEPDLLMFQVANMGERPVHVSGVGWITGWLAFGPDWLARKSAVQLTGGVYPSVEVPFDVQIGSRAATYALLENLQRYARERAEGPLFTRDWPVLGRRRTRILAYVVTADGYTFRVRPEKSFVEAMVKAEQEAVHPSR